MGEKQLLIAEPPEGSVVNNRKRTLGKNTLETKQIRDMVLMNVGTKKETYLVRVDGGMSHNMKVIGQNPKYVVFYNDQPLATCGVNYVPLFNEEIEACAMKALASIGRNPVSIHYNGEEDQSIDGSVVDINWNEKKEYRWKMTAILEKDFEVPMGHLRQSDKFDWGIGITNSYDLTEGIHIYMYIYRQICSNGLYAWSVSGKKNFIHVEKELNHQAILDKITEGIATIVEEHGTFFTRLDEMSKITPTRDQVKLLMKRLGIRKYEAAMLADRGIFIEFDGAEIVEVSLDIKVATEYDVLNAITSVSQETNTMKRQMDLQTGLMEKVLQARTISPQL